MSHKAPLRACARYIRRGGHLAASTRHSLTRSLAISIPETLGVLHGVIVRLGHPSDLAPTA